jgi:hypothetical protein
MPAIYPAKSGFSEFKQRLIAQFQAGDGASCLKLNIDFASFYFSLLITVRLLVFQHSASFRCR